MLLNGLEAEGIKHYEPSILIQTIQRMAVQAKRNTIFAQLILVILAVMSLLFPCLKSVFSNVSEYFVNRNKALSTSHNSLLAAALLQRDGTKMEVNKTPYEIILTENKDRAKTTLARLKSLRNRLAEIRLQVESLRKLQAENIEKAAVCLECDRKIEQGQEVTIKDQTGNPTGFYHRDCFKTIWSSQNWRFDYSSPGFLSKPNQNPTH